MSPHIYRSVLTWSVLCVGAGMFAFAIRATDNNGANGAEKPARSAASETTEQPIGRTQDCPTDVRFAKPTALEMKLEQPVTLDFKSTPLSDVAKRVEGEEKGISPMKKGSELFKEIVLTSLSSFPSIDRRLA